jgi:plastocyanin
MQREFGARPPGALHPSRPAEADGDFPGFDDDGNATAAGEVDHPLELFRVATDVDVGEGNLSTRVVLTGRGRVRSGVLSENLDAALFHARMIAAVRPVSVVSRVPCPASRPLWAIIETRMATRVFAVGAVLFALSTSVFGPRAAGAAGSVNGRVLLLKGGSPRSDASNAIVWIEGPRGAAGSGTVRMAQESKRFVPRVAIVPRQGTVEFPNNDPVYHNVFSVSGSNRFDLGLYRSGASKSRSFDEPGLVRVYCNIHPQMVGFLMVVDSPFAAVTDRDGAFRFEGVPAGTWTLKAWHEEGTEASAPITVPLSGSEPLTISIDTSAFRPLPHRNKYGKEYPPPSGSEDERY